MYTNGRDFLHYFHNSLAWVESEHTMVVSLSIFGMELDSGLCAVRMALDALC